MNELERDTKLNLRGNMIHCYEQECYDVLTMKVNEQKKLYRDNIVTNMLIYVSMMIYVNIINFAESLLATVIT